MKIFRIALAGLAASAPLFFSQAFAQATPQALANAFVDAVAKKDAEAIASLYTADAASFGPDGSLAAGREQIKASWAPLFDDFENIVVTLSPLGVKMLGADAATSWGRYTMTMTPIGGNAEADPEDGGPISSEGRYSDVMVRTPDGWRYVVDHADETASGDM